MASLSVFAIHFFVARKIKAALTNFSCLQSVVVLIGVLEAAMIGDKKYYSPDEMLLATALIGCLSTISHNQTNLLISFVTGLLYSLLRTYFIIGRTDLLRYFKFNISLATSFILIYI
jgi:hypothetical protein